MVADSYHFDEEQIWNKIRIRGIPIKVKKPIWIRIKFKKRIRKPACHTSYKVRRSLKRLRKQTLGNLRALKPIPSEN
jgi:hypothetical protein